LRRRRYKFYIRKTHRYLGVFIGIQFLFWTVGGLYFSWTDIGEIRGEHLRKEPSAIDFGAEFISPKTAVENVGRDASGAKIEDLRLIRIGGEPFYEFTVMDKSDRKRFIIADAVSGKIRPLITKAEAETIANASLVKPQKISSTVYLTEKNVGGHHEYREKPLPAWAVAFEDGLTVYLSAETGQIGAFRTNSWRVFDFFWMLHTLDFAGRDNINNYVLRAFSILGLATILSGFLLFFADARLFKKTGN
jgi:hypothetical protein